MLITDDEVIEQLKKYNISINGVLHLGAHECEEINFYRKMGIDMANMVWIDGNRDKVEEAKNRRIPNIIYAVISDEDDKEVEFNITNNGQSSSILEFGTHSKHHPHVYFTEKQIHKTKTLDKFYNENNLDIRKYDFWNLDIQGAELMALKGGKLAIEHVKAIYSEVNIEEVYKGCALMSEIDEYLSKYGFKRVLTKMTEYNWGDALYLKLPNIKQNKKLVIYVPNNWYPHRNNYAAIQRMCRACSIEFEVSDNIERLKENNYTILMTTTVFVDPSIIPENIKIIYGPHFFVFPEGHVVGELQNKLVNRCVYNSLSQWVKELYYEMVPSLIMPVESLPFGVDTSSFQPRNQEKTLDCLVYFKLRSSNILENTLRILDRMNVSYSLIKYGSYNEEHFKNELSRAKFMLVLDRHESQGFALEEAMACNVPLLVMDCESMYDEMPDGHTSIYQYLRPKKLLATVVPYWSDECGIKITNYEELPEAIDKMRRTYQTFNPRDYILRTLSDEVCMRRILDYFKL